ncbi:nucleoside triphosphate pyrophosphohydrolase [Sphingomonas sp.]|uniref:nucleoside triphosphate pyrophosphohydrolase n=1 Tax=Sphingomonas sp. TaxID=28214 RepID=UPI000DB105E5|nr:nucleoside triphosphate pyrophosphohydrolase [Sphingomonas sp.]PZU08544.1 MAG: nucleoside triphosphate pyrophosphohydrolase [Sphingomonas sp.]
MTQPATDQSENPIGPPPTEQPVRAPDPAANTASAAEDALRRLIAIMAKLRDPETGCPWDVEQTFATIAPYTIEEAYEVADACASGDLPALKDELGDLLLQVVFHARIAEELGAFAFADVANAISAKMIRRHPHVFSDAPRSNGHGQWEAIKAEERREKPIDPSALAGVALALPGLMRAEKLQKRAARTGFDWPDAEGARAKIVEEMDEIATAGDAAAREEEMGDLLFSVVNYARKLGVDPEVALRAGNAKFERRFRMMEGMAGDAFSGLSLEEKEALWQRAKQG